MRNFICLLCKAAIFLFLGAEFDKSVFFIVQHGPCYDSKEESRKNMVWIHHPY